VLFIARTAGRDLIARGRQHEVQESREFMSIIVADANHAGLAVIWSRNDSTSVSAT